MKMITITIAIIITIIITITIMITRMPMIKKGLGIIMVIKNYDKIKKKCLTIFRIFVK